MANRQSLFAKIMQKNETGRLLPDLFLFLKKASCGKSESSADLFQYMWIALYLRYNNNKL